MASSGSSTSTALLLESLVMLIEPQVSWSCKIVAFLLQRNVYYLIREIIFMVKVNFSWPIGWYFFFSLLHEIVIYDSWCSFCICIFRSFGLFGPLSGASIIGSFNLYLTISVFLFCTTAITSFLQNIIVFGFSYGCSNRLWLLSTHDTSTVLEYMVFRFLLKTAFRDPLFYHGVTSAVKYTNK